MDFSLPSQLHVLYVTYWHLHSLYVYVAQYQRQKFDGHIVRHLTFVYHQNPQQYVAHIQLPRPSTTCSLRPILVEARQGLER